MVHKKHAYYPIIKWRKDYSKCKYKTSPNSINKRLQRLNWVCLMDRNVIAKLSGIDRLFYFSLEIEKEISSIRRYFELHDVYGIASAIWWADLLWLVQLNQSAYVYRNIFLSHHIIITAYYFRMHTYLWPLTTNYNEYLRQKGTVCLILQIVFLIFRYDK